MTLHKADDGSFYRDSMMLFYTDAKKSELHIYTIDPDVSYNILHNAIVKLSSQNRDDPLAKLVKAALRAFLIVNGNSMLDRIFATKDHPRIGKKDDLLDWYTDMFVKIGISWLMKNDIFLQGHAISDKTSNIDAVSTRPVTSEETAATTEDNRATVN